MKRTILLAVFAACVSAGAAFAHHSFAATYNEEVTVKIEGEMVEFMFRNPHSFIQVDVAEKGAKVRYVIEWAAGQTLNNEGVNRDTLRAGDKVIVQGKPGRVPEDHRMRLVSVERPSDGWKWSGTFE